MLDIAYVLAANCTDTQDYKGSVDTVCCIAHTPISKLAPGESCTPWLQFAFLMLRRATDCPTELH
jgi:hypothetical protein